MNLNINLDNIGDYYSDSDNESEENNESDNYENESNSYNEGKGVPGVRLPNEMRFPDKPTNQAPTGYLTIQNRINSRNGKIDPKEFNSHLREMVKQGWLEINDLNDAEKFIVPGMRIRYITKDGYFRTGGWVVLFREDTDETGKLYKWLVYKGHNNVTFSLQYGGDSDSDGDVHRLFFIQGNAKRKVSVENKIPVQKIDSDGIKIYKPNYKYPEYQSDHPVYLNDKNGEKVVVYYADSNSKKNRFMKSMKYKSSQKYGWSFFE